MQMIGRSRMDSFFFFFFAVSVPASLPCPSFLFRVANRMLIAACQIRNRWREEKSFINKDFQHCIRVILMSFLLLILCSQHTEGAPSISSIMRQFGLSLAPKTDFICVAVSMRFWNTSALRSSLQKHQQCHWGHHRRIIVNLIIIIDSCF